MAISLERSQPNFTAINNPENLAKIGGVFEIFRLEAIVKIGSSFGN